MTGQRNGERRANGGPLPPLRSLSEKLRKHLHVGPRVIYLLSPAIYFLKINEEKMRSVQGKTCFDHVTGATLLAEVGEMWSPFSCLERQPGRSHLGKGWTHLLSTSPSSLSSPELRRRQLGPIGPEGAGVCSRLQLGKLSVCVPS